jgi:hypothetical protein
MWKRNRTNFMGVTYFYRANGKLPFGPAAIAAFDITDTKIRSDPNKSLITPSLLSPPI